MNWISKKGAGTRRRAVGFVALLLAVLMTTPAWADDGEAAEQTPRLFALPADSLQGEVSQIVTERINDAVRDRYETLDGVELVPTFEALHGSAGGDAAHAAVAEAERQYTSGIGLVNAGEYEDAAETLQMAVQVMEENVGELREFDILVDALLNLAIAHHETGYDLDARDTIEQYAHVQPDAELDPDSVPADLRSLYEQEVDRIERAGEAILHIEADREGAQVYIDGELKGPAPLTVDDVGFGEHYMVVRDADWEWSDKIQVRARGQEQDIDVELRDPEQQEDRQDELPSFYVDLRQSLRSGQFGTELQPYLRELASQTGADYISWILVVSEGRDYAAAPFLYRLEDGVVIQGDNVTFDRQLSNVRSQADALSDTVAAAVIHMPEDRVVDDVDMVEDYESVEEPVAEVEDDQELAGVDEDHQPDQQEPTDDRLAAEDRSEDEDQQVAVADDERPSEELPVPGPEAADADGIEQPGIDDHPDERDNRMRYLGWGGAAVATTGVVAGTVFLLVRGGDSEAPGFDVEVEW